MTLAGESPRQVVPLRTVYSHRGRWYKHVTTSEVLPELLMNLQERVHGPIYTLKSRHLLI